MSLIVNGKAYDWGDVDIALSGLSGLQPTEISYDDELEKELVYGAGYKARGYGRGNYKTNAKITVSRDDYDIILDYCKRVGKKFYEIEVPKLWSLTPMMAARPGLMSSTKHSLPSGA